MTRLLVLLLLVLPFTTARAEENPPAKGFNTAASDPKAIAVADQAMTALGGRKNWDATRYITWRFFGFRLHVWDKWTGDIRFEQGELTVLMNIHSKEGAPSPPNSNTPIAPGSTTPTGSSCLIYSNTAASP